MFYVNHPRPTAVDAKKEPSALTVTSKNRARNAPLLLSTRFMISLYLSHLLTLFVSLYQSDSQTHLSHSYINHFSLYFII